MSGRDNAATVSTSQGGGCASTGLGEPILLAALLRSRRAVERAGRRKRAGPDRRRADFMAYGWHAGAPR